MTRFGYTLMTEQNGPKDLVRYAISAEHQGFDFEVSSDHFSPWLASQGHAPNAWAVLGAVAQVTERVDLYTYVTCPTMRYHPAIVAQQAATLQILADGRFTLGLGSGENLNEHVVGKGWPAITQRQDMLREAIEIIRALFDGDLVDWRGDYYQVDSARLWDLPDVPVGIGVAMGGKRRSRSSALLADHLIAVEPDGELVRDWHTARQANGVAGGGRVVGQIPICWDPDRDAAVERAHDQFRWFGGGWKVNADLPTPAGFAGATQFVRPEDVAESIPCGPDLDAIVDAVRPYWEAGFTDIALVQVGGETQEQFLKEAAEPLLAALRSAAAGKRKSKGELQMSNSLQGKKVAILAADGVEKVELEQPRAALSEKGAQVQVLSLKTGEIQARNHDLEPAGTIEVDRTVSDASVDEFDALVLPGGTVNPDKLRLDSSAVAFVRDFVNSGKPVAAICHGPWTLVEAGVVAGRTLTSYPSIRTDLRNAGAKVVDEEVVVDRNLITSRSPSDLPAFCAAIVEQLEQAPVRT